MSPSSNARHTPGPWLLQDHPHDPCEVYTDDQDIGTVFATDTDCGVANARLIASAPALLAALQGVIELHDRGLSLRDFSIAEKACRSAIALATKEGAS